MAITQTTPMHKAIVVSTPVPAANCVSPHKEKIMNIIDMHRKAPIAATDGHKGVKQSAIAVGVLAAVALLAAPGSALAFEPLPKLVTSDGFANEQAGDAVAVDGDTAVFGSTYADNHRGAVYVFQRVAGVWKQTGKLTASAGATGDALGVSVAIDGDTIVAGAPGHAIGGKQYRGAVYTFSRTGSATRLQTATLYAVDGKQGDRLGDSVAIDGDTIVAGAPDASESSQASEGAVYTFARVGGSARTQTAKLTASDAGYFTQLGRSVAIDGDTIVAGATKDIYGCCGAVYTFARNGAAARTETAKLTASDAARGAYLGYSVAIEGGTIVAGAPGFGTPSELVAPGAVYTFARTGPSARKETAKLIASDGVDEDVLGESVAIAGDTIIAGASGDNAERGSVYKFARVGAPLRTQKARLHMFAAMAEDWLGSDVAMSGDTIVASVPGRDVNTNENQGIAVVFEP